MAKVEHFEIPADDVERAKAFYGGVFDFQFDDWDEDTVMIKPSGEDGMGGDIHKRSTVPHPTIVITVDDLDETMAAVIANGGEQVGQVMPLGETARYGYFRDSEGNLVGVYDSRA